jgi:alpha-mannosidase
VSQTHLVVVPHTHWDREWYRTHEDFRYRLVGLLDGLLDLLEGDPSFRHFTLDGQTIVLDDYLEVRPQARERIARLVREGRLLIGPWHVLPDEWLVSGEALIRNLRLGLAKAAEFGGAMSVGYVPDQFGHVGQLPQIFAGFGFEGAVLWRGVGDDIDDTTFFWEAPDGTRMFGVYLVHGYGNAMNLSLDSASLARRIEGEIENQMAHSKIGSVLLMNGGDHLHPQPGLPTALAAAVDRLDGVTFEVGTLPGFLARARAEAPAGLSVHRGELRSGLRAPLLEGCASSRMRQKRLDFLNDRLLTRYLEPLAAWLDALGGDADPGRIEFAWRVALENHPHDSICGCSIDAVHEEMEVRFARLSEIGGAHLRHVTRELARRIAVPTRGFGRGAREAVAVWNPNPGGRAQAEGVLELELPAGARRAPRLHLRDASGRRIPSHAELVEAGPCYSEYAMPAPVARVMLEGFPPEFFGQVACALHLRRRGGRCIVDLLMGDECPASFDFSAEKRAVAAELDELGGAEVLYRVRRLSRVRLRFVDDLPGWGLRRYRVARGGAGPDGAPEELRASPSADGGAVIENQAWRIEVAPDGRVHWTDRRTGIATPDALRLRSEGDRGDSYTFDPVPAAATVDRPSRVRVSLAPSSQAEVGIALDLGYRVPEGLTPDRTERSSRSVSLAVRIGLRLARGLDRLDVTIDVDNRARDQRLRVHLRAPFEASRFEVESAFEVADRPIAPAPNAFGNATPAELPVGATPQRSFASIGDGVRALTVANRGCSEVEAVPEPGGRTSLALTVLRAVGWLSRDDLVSRPGHAGPPIETPGAQVPGPHRIEFSLRAHPDGDATRTAEAHRFAFAPLLFAGEGPDDAPLGDGARLLEVDDPAVVVSAVEPRPDRSPNIRLYNASPDERRVRIRHHLPGARGLERIDLNGRPLAGAEAPPAASTAATLTLRPWQIAALRPGSPDP